MAMTMTIWLYDYEQSPVLNATDVATTRINSWSKLYMNRSWHQMKRVPFILMNYTEIKNQIPKKFDSKIKFKINSAGKIIFKLNFRVS